MPSSRCGMRRGAAPVALVGAVLLVAAAYTGSELVLWILIGAAAGIAMSGAA